MTYRYIVWDYKIEIAQPKYAADFDEDGNPTLGYTYKEAKKILVTQLRENLKLVKEQNEEDFLKEKGYT